MGNTRALPSLGVGCCIVFHVAYSSIAQVRIKSFIFSPFSVNTYVLSDEVSGAAIIVDCACTTDLERGRLFEYLESEHLNVLYAFNTHLHFDHVLGNRWLYSRFNVKPLAHYLDEYCIEWNLATSVFLPLSLQQRDELSFSDYLWINGNQSLTIGDDVFSIIHLPGHTPGSCSLYCERKRILIDGDVLFKNTIGRTDLEMGDDKKMKESLSSLMSLPEDTLVLPGHGESTTISNEKGLIRIILQ